MTNLVCNSLGNIWSNNSRYRSCSIRQPHKHSSIAWSYVQVVTTEARENQPTRAHSYNEKGHSCGCSGTKVTTKQQKASRQGECWRRERSKEKNLVDQEKPLIYHTQLTDYSQYLSDDDGRNLFSHPVGQKASTENEAGHQNVRKCRIDSR